MAHDVTPVDVRQDASRRLAVGFSGIDLAVVVADEMGGIVFSNVAAQRLFEAIPHGPLVSASVVKLLEKALSGRPHTESVAVHDQSRRTLSVSARPILGQVEILGAIATIEDVSERRRLDAVRRDFVANVSHELKTPIGALGLLADALDGEVEPEVVARLVRRIQTESTRIGRMIDDLLDLSRIEEQGAVGNESMPAAMIAGQAVDGVQQLAAQRSIVIDATGVPRSVLVSGDIQQLVTALRNLIENAVKYSDVGSTVAVTCLVVDGNVEFTVEDHGLGIPSRDVTRIFERFYRVDRARARDTGGTGLGLAIVRHVAENHHGSVRVASREGEGSRFTLVIPLVT